MGREQETPTRRANQGVPLRESDDTNASGGYDGCWAGHHRTFGARRRLSGTHPSQDRTFPVQRNGSGIREHEIRRVCKGFHRRGVFHVGGGDLQFVGSCGAVGGAMDAREDGSKITKVGIWFAIVGIVGTIWGFTIAWLYPAIYRGLQKWAGF